MIRSSSFLIALVAAAVLVSPRIAAASYLHVSQAHRATIDAARAAGGINPTARCHRLHGSPHRVFCSAVIPGFVFMGDVGTLYDMELAAIDRHGRIAVYSRALTTFREPL